jgi:diguanylate cyclase (GGDEF)-like protein
MLPWTLLLSAMVVIVVANVIPLGSHPDLVATGWLLDALGNLLALAAALALTLRHGLADLGGIIDTSVLALATGGLLWGVLLPHRLGTDESLAAQVDLFVVVLALTGVLGALIRLRYSMIPPAPALRWLNTALAVGIGANVVLSLAGAYGPRLVAADLLFMGAFVALGLFGLDPTGPRLAYASDAATVERLSTGRLAALGVAVALIPVVIGIRELLGGSVDGLLLAVQGTLVSVLVMVRIGLLSGQRDRAERALVYQAAHDPVTGLPNRREFVARLRNELERGRPCALLFCDLDDFKSVNDRFGHSAGDMLLVEVARRIVDCAPPPNLVSRFGGDEYVVLLVDSTAEQAKETRERVAGSITRPYDEAGGATVGVSIGIALSDGERDPEEQIRAADQAMYKVKLARRS